MVALTKLNDHQTQHILLYGPPKSGKTIVAGMLAEHYNLKYISMEGGYNVLLENVPAEWQARIEVLDVKDTTDYPIAAETVPKLMELREFKVCTTHSKVNCPLCIKEGNELEVWDFSKFGVEDVVIFDSGTRLSASIMAHLMRTQPADAKNERDDYRKQGQLLDQFFSRIQNAPFHIIYITHENSVKMIDGSDKITPIAGTGNYSRNVAKFFDEVVYAGISNGKHFLASSTGYKANMITGGRASMELSKLDYPTLLPLFKPELFPELKKEILQGKPKAPNITGVDSTLGQGETAGQRLMRMKKEAEAKKATDAVVIK